MKYLSLGKNEKVSCIGIGCMRIAGMNGKDVDTLVKTALDEGINFFDHADIYGGGQSEEIFGRLLAEEPGLREKMFIQSKWYFDKAADGPSGQFAAAQAGSADGAGGGWRGF